MARQDVEAAETASDGDEEHSLESKVSSVGRQSADGVDEPMLDLEVIDPPPEAVRDLAAKILDLGHPVTSPLAGRYRRYQSHARGLAATRTGYVTFLMLADREG
jgi:hypothetical protein